jgi:drug/metabolite transporter (DMT)-like permease
VVDGSGLSGSGFFSFGALQQARAQAARCVAVDPIEAANQRQLAFVWALTTAVMLLLGINKQLDLQSFLTETLRDWAIADGWYEQRRKYQVGAIVALGAAGVLAVAAGAYLVRRVLRRAAGVVIGLGLVVTFVLIRAASFHKVDVILTHGPVRWNWVLELGAIGIVAASALRNGCLRRRGQ